MLEEMTRRGFLGLAPAIPLLRFPFAGTVPLVNTAGGVPASFPQHDPAVVREVVQVSHGNLERVKELVGARPALARVSWDWGFGDWETPIDAASHVGHRPIAEFLMTNGARPTIYTAAMMGQLAIVKRWVEAVPGVQRNRGPHGITLLAHARFGGAGASQVYEYLQSLGDADPKYVSSREHIRIARERRFSHGSQPGGAEFRVELPPREDVLEAERIGRGAVHRVSRFEPPIGPRNGADSARNPRQVGVHGSTSSARPRMIGRPGDILHQSFFGGTMRLSSIRARRRELFAIGVFVALACDRLSSHAPVYAEQAATKAATAQKLDEDYTSRIKKATPDPRIITEYVDHMPVSTTVPSPLKFFGYVPGEPGHLTYHADIVRYYEALEKASPRVRLFRIGKSEEGRDMVALAIADEATIKQLDKFQGITAKLTDPRAISEAQARQLIASGKPIYYACGSIHTPETGSPEMLIELAFRLAVEETPFIQTIRNNDIVVLTPATEVDGREKVVDNFNFSLKNPGKPQPGLVYWGQYVQHDNNRDGIGVGLHLTQNILKSFLTWHPTVFHDLHESVTLLYVSTGTGPYNTIVDPIQINEWWLLAQNEMMEMVKRNVPGVWTYNYYDGWVPNYMFWIGVTHNSIGRFYETQSFRGQNYAMGPLNQSREWYRPNPTPNDINWGPRANVNMQESAILISMNNVARNKETFLENYYLKNKHTVERGQTKAPYAYVVPAGQRRRVEAAELMNLVRREGAEVHTANSEFTVGNVAVAKGDYIVRMDQPYAAIVETLLGVQFYAPENPRPYDDTGWSIPLLRNLKAIPVADKSILQEPMTLASADFTIPGVITGTGPVLVVDHTAENTLVTFRFTHKDVKMSAAEQPFDAGGHHFAAGAFVIPNASRAALEPSIKELGLSAWAIDGTPNVPMHDLEVPRIGYIHTWTSTQDEGWVRMAFDKFKVPYTYFGDNLVRQGNLRQKYDVIVFPHAGGSGTSLVYGGLTGNQPLPYKKTDDTPHLGIEDSTDDMRGGLGYDGLQELYKFVHDGGVLITEGSTATIFPMFNMTQGITIETPENLYVRGSVLKTVLGDRTSPVLYGYDQNALAVYFNQAPVLAVGGGGFGARGGGGRGGGPNIQGIPNMEPNRTQPRLTTLESGNSVTVPATGIGVSGSVAEGSAPAGAGRGGRGAGRGGAGRGGGVAAAGSAGGAAGEAAPPGFGGGGFSGRGGGAAAGPQPRVLLAFPNDPNDLLLSGLLVGGESLAGRAVAIDAPVGKGHVIMFANRPFWRWQTQGNFFLGFNAILNWDHLDAGRTPRPAGMAQQ